MKTSTKTTVKLEILAFLTGRGWESKIRIQRNSDYWKTGPENIGRRCRELYDDGQLDKKIVGKTVYYRLPPEPLSNYLNALEAERQVSIL